MQIQHHVSQAAIDDIVKSLRNFQLHNSTKLINNILNIIYRHDPSFTGEGEILKVFNNDLFYTACDEENGIFRSKHMRQKFVKDHMKYVEPVEIKMNTTSSTEYYHYIPLKSTLKNLMSDPSVRVQFHNVQSGPANSYSDVHDGYVFKDNKFLSSGNKIELVLYQDSFQVVNPLGSAKNKHKLVGVYYTIANLYPYNKSQIKSYQLVMLIKESVLKKHSPKIIFKPIIDELTELHDEGFDLGLSDKVKGGLLMILGDNLGSHYIGGYVESFVAHNFCRYCNIQKKEFHEGISASSLRTSKCYDDDASKAEEIGAIYNGIKFSSPFNKIPDFHVAMPGLPPCLGHDLFEGVVSYDLLHILKHICVVKKWTTFDQINKAISIFTYKSFDANDKPPPINFKSEKLSGHAVQNLVLLRNIPLILQKYILEYDEPVWQLVLTLKVIVGFVCAPSISCGQVCYMERLINEYIEKLRDMFPSYRLKPKHHYLSHYGLLIRAFGPLLHSSTLRMEQKHQFFKRSIARSGNYKNITKHAANKHSLLQAYSLESNLFDDDVVSDKAITLNLDLYSDDIQEVVYTKLGNNCAGALISNEFSYKNISYLSGDIVIISLKPGGMTVGVIDAMLLIKNVLYFIVKVKKSVYDGRTDSYIMADEPNSVKLCSVHELMDPFPLPVHKIDSVKFINLKHSINNGV